MRNEMRIRILCVLALFLITWGGCSELNDDRAIPTDTYSPVASETPGVAPDKAAVVGSMGNGNTYALHCPDDWNGDLVVYAHGYAFPDTDPTLPDADDEHFVALRDAILAMGYGIAFSSYSETGWSVREGMNQTRQLRGLFAAGFGMPERTFLMGKSMGGLIAVALAERNPGLYDGVLPICGAVGGTDMAVDYIFTVRALFDYYYPGVLPGTACYVPEDFHWSQAQGAAYMALMANPYPAFEMAGVNPLPVQYASPEELFDAIITAIVFHAAGYADFMDRTHGHNLFDNMDVVYTGSANDAALNEGIVRCEGTKDAIQFTQRLYEPNGKLKIPAITLHTSRDQVVQRFHEYEYGEKVDAAGYGDNLRQYEIDRFGHCQLAVEEILIAFEELVGWADSMETEGAILIR